MGIPIGTKYGNLTTIEKPKKTNGVYGVLCECSCGNKKIFQPSVLKNGRTKKCRECSRTPLPDKYGDFINLKHKVGDDRKLYVEMECKNCHNIKISKKSTINGEWNINCPVCKEETSQNGICITLFKKIKLNALKRNIKFLITSKYLNDLYITQNKKCALTGVDIFLAPKSIRVNHDVTTASLDRIDSSLGYVEGNVRWVHKVINQFISDFSDDEVFYLCDLILKNNNVVNNNLDINSINKLKQRNNKNTTKKKIEGNPTKKPISQYSLNMVLIREYSSINEAVRELNLISPLGIISTCKGRQKSSGGFIWKYKK
jgi:hypothetical protein